MAHKILFCCRVSLEIFNEKSSTSTTAYGSGISSSQSSLMETRRIFNLMLLRFFFVSNKSKGTRRGTNKNARNSTWPSSLKEMLHTQVVLPLRWLVQVDARGQERRIEKEPDQILHRLVRFVCQRLRLHLRHDGVLDLHRLLGDHQRNHELSRDACAFMMRSGESTILSPTITFSTLSTSTSFMELRQRFELRFQLLKFFLLFFVTMIQSLLRCGFQVLSVELLALLHGMLIHEGPPWEVPQDGSSPNFPRTGKRTRRRCSRQ